MHPARRAAAALVTAGLVSVGLVVVPTAASAAEEVYPAPASGSWTVEGRAYGHGRGMSQWGAQGAALQGLSADQILSFYYPGTASTNLGNPFVRVVLSQYAPTTTVTVWSPLSRPIRMGPLNGETILPPGRWTVTVSGQTVTAQRRDTPTGPVTETRSYTGVLRFESQQEVGMIIASSSTATTGRWYRGDLRIEPTGGTGFNVSNNLPMEDYLRSVVPRESPASWQPAALQAQAVAARSYAWYRFTKSTLCDTTSCQVYYGRADANAAGNATQSWEHANTDAAIAATAGRVLTYGGDVAFTEFSSSNGGWTTAGGVPYQVAKADPYTGTAPGDTVTAWTATLEVSRVAQSCPGTGGTLRNLVVTGRTGNGPLGGRITQVRLECSTGNATVSSPAFGLRSSWWRPKPVTPRLESLAQSTTVMSYGAQMSLAATPNVAVTWTLRVVDSRTRSLVNTRTGSAEAGQRFNATWFGSSAAGSFVGAGTYDLELSAVAASGVVTNSYRTTVEVRAAPDPPTEQAVGLVANAGYVAVTPTRLVDTRQTFASIGAQQRVDIPVTGQAGVPATGVTAVVLNVTAVGASRDTHLRIWPAGSPRPDASVLNTDAQRTQASLVTVGVGGGGKVSLYNAAGSLHYVIDVLGYYTTNLGASSRYTPVDPVRALDTRSTAALAAGAPRQVDVAAALGVPAGSISAVTANITAVRASGPGYVVAYGGGAQPGTSTVNLLPGADVANRAVVPVVDGKITVALDGTATHVVVDVVGWYARPGVTSGALFTPTQPTRLLDSRSGSAFGPGQSSAVTVTGSPVPAGAVAVVGTLTATGQTSPATHARIWPAGVALTPTSDLNSGIGRTQANAVVVRVGDGGAVMVYNDQGSSHLILDVSGYFN